MAEVSKRQRMEELLEKAQNCSDETKRANILEERGRLCIGQSWVKRAKEAAKTAASDAEFLDNLEKVYPMLKREPGKVYVVYPKCYCSVKGKGPHYYCDCSVGWVKEMFEQALGRSIEVKLESSIIHGDKECRLRVMF